jgi:regulator of RNase E activity RraA
MSARPLAKAPAIGNVPAIQETQKEGPMPATLTPKQMEFLKSIDTPTVCNIVEMVAPERRGHGYTTKHLFCPFPDLPPIVGFAKTVTAKAKDKVAAGDYMTKRMDYLDYVASEPRPSISVIEDLDDEVGYGAFWGEVQSNIHLALGCQGVITNGSIRDIPMIAKGFQMLAGSYAPSHAYTHVEDFGIDVTVHGMKVKSGDLIHADQHGAIVVPLNILDKLPAALDEINAKEAKIIKAAKEVGTVEAIKAAIRG